MTGEGGTRLVRWMVPAAALLWAAALAYSMLAARSLYGDGALYVLIHFQVPHKFDDYDLQRTFATYLTQAPILLAERFGVERVSVYAALYSLGLYVLPAAAVLFGAWLLRRQPVPFAAVTWGAVVFGFGVNYINSEANLFFGLAWLCVSILALDRPAPVLRGFLLPLIAIVLLRVYEAMLLVGPVLAAWSVLAGGRATYDRERFGLGIAALLFTVGAAIGSGGLLSPRDPGNAVGFIRSIASFLAGPHLFLLLAAVAAAVAALVPHRPVALGAVAASALLGIAYLVIVVRVQGYYSYDFYYQNRAFLALLLPAAVGAVFMAWWLRPAWFATAPMTPVAAAFLVPFAFAIAADWIGTHRWVAYVDKFCEVLRSEANPPERLAQLKHSGVRTGWGWTHPTLSVLLRDRGSNAMVANEPPQRWEPFDASNPPRIGRLGLCQAPLIGGKP